MKSQQEEDEGRRKEGEEGPRLVRGHFADKAIHPGIILHLQILLRSGNQEHIISSHIISLRINH